MSKKWLKFFDYLYLCRVKGLTDQEAVERANALRGFFVWLGYLRLKIRLRVSMGARMPGEGARDA